jgi:hypothetical protein
MGNIEYGVGKQIDQLNQKIANLTRENKWIGEVCV